LSPIKSNVPQSPSPYVWEEKREIHTCSDEYLLTRARRRNDHLPISGLPKRDDETLLEQEKGWEEFRKTPPSSESYTQQYREGELYVGLGRPWKFNFAEDVIMKEMVVLARQWIHKDELRRKLAQGAKSSKLPVIDQVMKHAVLFGAMKEKDGKWKSNWGLT